ncbi:MAG: putative motility protein [Agathobacter sp.]|nr:putative motility protein [Agathobacter sp.]
MEIGAINSALSAVTTSKPGSVAAETSMAMLNNTLDINNAMGQSMIKMMENSVNPAVGGNFDMSV